MKCECIGPHDLRGPEKVCKQCIEMMKPEDEGMIPSEVIQKIEEAIAMLDGYCHWQYEVHDQRGTGLFNPLGYRDKGQAKLKGKLKGIVNRIDAGVYNTPSADSNEGEQ